MKIGKDNLSRSILNLINETEEPLETREIENLLNGKSRTMILYRLNNFRGESLIKGKQVGSGKGTWIWWKKGGEKNKQNEK